MDLQYVVLRLGRGIRWSGDRGGDFEIWGGEWGFGGGEWGWGSVVSAARLHLQAVPAHVP